MMPAAPLVGAVTTRPPVAFCSFTASAYRFTQSMTVSGSRRLASGRLNSVRYRSAARRRTFSPPGMIPCLLMPMCTHSCITFQIFSKPARVSASGRQLFSFSSMSWLIDSRCSAH